MNFNYVNAKQVIDQFQQYEDIIQNMVKEKTRNDLLYKLNHEIIDYWSTKNITLNAANFHNIMSYLLLIPTDNSKAFFVELKKQECFKELITQMLSSCKSDNALATKKDALLKRIQGVT